MRRSCFERRWPGFVRTVLLFSFAVSFQPAWAEFKVGLVLDRGGKDDKSFNSSAYEGAMQARNTLGIFLKYVEAADDNARNGSLT